MYLRVLRHVVRSSAFARLGPFSRRFYSSKTSKPLRILFCGSDDFSIASLRALHEEQKRDPQLIKSIDVLCRPGKPSGRSLKTIREVPIKAAALELGLPVHERDTFTGWNLPRPQDEPINLIIAVSFGLFVPPRILRSVEYGGLNVHPSLLPNFRGPAPLQHTIMTGVNSTGVTLQTMDEVSFDHGMILAQTPPNGLQVPSLDTCTYEELLEFITPKAAEMLVQGIRDRAYVPPLKAVGWYESDQLVPAPKITPKHRHIDWESWEASRIHRHHRALGRLWNRVYVDSHTETTKRLIYEDIEVAPMPDVLAEWLAESRPDATGKIIPQESDSLVRFVVYQDTAGAPKPLPYIVDGDAVVFAAFPPSMGKGIRVKEITMEGQRKKAASKVMQNFQGREAWELMKGSGETFGVNPVPPLVKRD